MALFEKKEEKAVKADIAKTADSLPLHALANRVLLSSRVTEKAYLLNGQNQYVFQISKSATKNEVGRAIEVAYGVRVEKVRTVNIPRKKKVSGRGVGFKSAVRKAIVTLPKGEEIPMFKGA
jgi:large subunit ribosomal protein L23